MSTMTPPHHSRASGALALVLAGTIGLGLATPAQGRALEDIKSLGVISLCAPPNAMPFASKRGDRPGYQIELAQTLADRLGVRLQVEWVTQSIQYNRVNCDIVMDAIADREAQAESPLRLSKPYQRSGVALVVRPGVDGVTGFDSLNGQYRVGVLVGSVAHMYLDQHGAHAISYGFEDDMLEALASGEIDAAAVTALSAGYYNLQHPAAKFRLIYAYDAVPELGWNLAVGMRRSDHFLRRAVDDAVQAMLDDGTFDRIYASYGIEHRPPEGQQIRRIRRAEPSVEEECVRLGQSRECAPAR
jgi:polar amino acid transport system substrate-binding protein